MLHPPARAGWHRVLTGSLDHDDGRELTGVVEAPPRRHVGDRVGTEEQEQLSVRCGQRLERVGGHRCPVALDLQGTRLEPVDLCHCGLDEGKPIRRVGDDLAALLPRVPGDHQQDPIEIERSPGIGRGDEVPDVNRVERPTQHAHTFLRRRHREQHTSRSRLASGFGGPLDVHSAVTRPKSLATYPGLVSEKGTYVLVRVWLPDRPGALGLVAARIGAVGGDIVGIDVLERSEGIAVDEFAVALPSLDVLDLLAKEIEQVDGTSVEEFRLVDAFPDPRLDALDSATRLCEADSVDELCETLVGHLRREFLADWVALLRDDALLAASGDTHPAAEFLSALAAETSASPTVADGTTGPEDLLVAALVSHDATLLVGRDGHPFRRRERAQLIALARIADRAWTLLPE